MGRVYNPFQVFQKIYGETSGLSRLQTSKNKILISQKSDYIQKRE